MSSSVDAGYYADQTYKLRKTKCKKSVTGKHKWITKGTGPSAYVECKHCKQCSYYK